MASKSKKRKQNCDEENDVSQTMNIDPNGDNRGRQLSIRHQLLLQYIIETMMVKKMQLSQIHGQIFTDNESLNESISTITNQIKHFKMDIKTVKCDLSGETYFVLVQTTGEFFFLKSCLFSKNQLDFFKQILVAIVLSPDGMIGKIGALNTCKQMSKSDADESLGLFVKHKLLMEINDSGQFCLTPLAIVSFGPSLNACYPDNLSTCDLCKQLVFVGKTCENSNCKVKFHLHCASTWLEKRSNCPTCGERWACEDNMSVDTE